MHHHLASAGPPAWQLAGRLGPVFGRRRTGVANCDRHAHNLAHLRPGLQSSVANIAIIALGSPPYSVHCSTALAADHRAQSPSMTSSPTPSPATSSPIPSPATNHASFAAAIASRDARPPACQAEPQSAPKSRTSASRAGREQARSDAVGAVDYMLPRTCKEQDLALEALQPVELRERELGKAAALYNFTQSVYVLIQVQRL